MKTVFDNDMVAHVYAQNTQYEGRGASGKVEKKPECNCIPCQISRNGYAEIEVPAGADMFSVIAGIMQELTLAELVTRRAQELAKEKDKGPIDT